VDGVPTARGSVQLVAAHHPWTWVLRGATTRPLDLAGRFELGGQAPGDYWLVVQLGGGDLDGAAVVRRLALEGGVEQVDVALASAPLELTGAVEAGEHAVVVRVEGAQVVVPVWRRADGGLRPVVAAAGAARLVRRGDGEGSDSALDWATVLELGTLEPRANLRELR